MFSPLKITSFQFIWEYICLGTKLTTVGFSGPCSEVYNLDDINFKPVLEGHITKICELYSHLLISHLCHLIAVFIKHYVPGSLISTLN